MRNANALALQPFHPQPKKSAAKHSGPRRGSSRSREEIGGPTETIGDHVQMHPQEPEANAQGMLQLVIVVQQVQDEVDLEVATKVAGKIAADKVVAVKVAAGTAVRVAATKVVEAETTAVEIAEIGMKRPKRTRHHVVPSRSNGLNLKSLLPRRCNRAKNLSDPSRI